MRLKKFNEKRFRKAAQFLSMLSLSRRIINIYIMMDKLRLLFLSSTAVVGRMWTDENYMKHVDLASGKSICIGWFPSRLRGNKCQAKCFSAFPGINPVQNGAWSNL